jgi:hypothetical protein
MTTSTIAIASPCSSESHAVLPARSTVGRAYQAGELYEQTGADHDRRERADGEEVSSRPGHERGHDREQNDGREQDDVELHIDAPG